MEHATAESIGPLPLIHRDRSDPKWQRAHRPGDAPTHKPTAATQPRNLCKPPIGSPPHASKKIHPYPARLTHVNRRILHSLPKV